MMPVEAAYATLLPVALRDTALTVTDLSGDAAPKSSFKDFRDKCNKQIEELRVQLRSAGHPRDVVEDAAYAQCALLDEAALNTLKGGDRDAWEHEPLQVVEFQTHDAGQELITRIERRLAEPQPVLPLLAIFGAVLSLGFTGKFAIDGRDARAALMRAVDARLTRDIGRMDTTGSVIVKQGGRHHWLDKLSPVVSVAIACVAAAVIYMAIDQWLNAAIDRLAQ
ncbi:DotU family type IV/VI secretion system protein [Paraburkholderia fungorum]|jgi:type VI secretion system protein ImpK|uniref:DotU family type IV/VI secretion system protein n=1 Tax=Paraburkholderia fungorum TaxID=134537 RepID=UPI0038BBB3A5